jgi:preprotein translocase subunit SecE
VWRATFPVPRREHFSWAGFESAPAYRTIAMANPFEFIQEVRAEASKVTWPSRKETMITTVMVLVMVLVASLFFMSVDQAIRLIVKFVLSLGH